MPPDRHATSFGRIATDYARARPTWPLALFDRLGTLAPGRGAAADVGAGAGQATTGLLSCFDRVYAVEPSATLRAAMPAHPRLVALPQAAEAMELPEPVDLVGVFQALHWFAGPAFWSRVAQSLRPGGLLAVAGYGWFYVDPAVDALIEQQLLPALAPHWSPRNRLVMEGYREVELPFPELPAGPPLAMELAWTRAQLLDYLGTWSAVSTLREQGTDPLAALGPLLRVAWPDEGVRVVTMPLFLRVFRP